MKKILLSTVLTEAFYKSRGELIEKFIELGYEVVLIGPDHDENIQVIFDMRKVTYYIVNFDRTGLSVKSDLNTIRSLIKIIKTERPNLIYSFGGAKAAIYTTIAGYLSKVDKIYCMVNGLGSIYRSQGIKNKIIKPVMNLLFRYSLSKADGVFFQNNDDLAVFSRSKLVLEEKCKIVNGSGVNLERFTYFEPNTEKIIFLFVGRLLRDKGIYEFAEAAKILKQEFVNSEFWVIGGYDSNPTAVSKDEIAHWHDKGYIKYLGRQNDILEYYQKCSVFVLPSYHEGTPRTNLEAMAVGRPIITTDAPGCRETVINEENGFLIPIQDVKALVEKMKYYILNPIRITEMGLESSKMAIEKYDVNKVNDSIIDFMLNNK